VHIDLVTNGPIWKDPDGCTEGYQGTDSAGATRSNGSNSTVVTWAGTLLFQQVACSVDTRWTLGGRAKFGCLGCPTLAPRIRVPTARGYRPFALACTQTPALGPPPPRLLR
jgi:hypothetical protein